jgi:hypothetical protein
MPTITTRPTLEEEVDLVRGPSLVTFGKLAASPNPRRVATLRLASGAAVFPAHLVRTRRRDAILPSSLGYTDTTA